MDVGTMSVEKQDELMKKGLCFRCKKFRHLSRDCSNKKKPTTSTLPKILTWSETPKKMGAKELYQHMVEKEKEEFFDEFEKGEGF